jgi:hypothetical protein
MHSVLVPAASETACLKRGQAALRMKDLDIENSLSEQPS